MNNKPKVLYVDDETINLDVFEFNFCDQYQIIASDSPLKALEILEKEKEIKLVVSDMRMPAMNGLEFITKAKNKHPEITYYILTGFDITDEIKEALNKKLINKYFSKPLNISEMLNCMREAVGD